MRCLAVSIVALLTVVDQTLRCEIQVEPAGRATIDGSEQVSFMSAVGSSDPGLDQRVSSGTGSLAIDILSRG